VGARKATLDFLEDASGGFWGYGLVRIKCDPPAREYMGKEEARMAEQGEIQDDDADDPQGGVRRHPRDLLAIQSHARVLEYLATALVPRRCEVIPQG